MQNIFVTAVYSNVKMIRQTKSIDGTILGSGQGLSVKNSWVWKEAKHWK